MARGRKKRATLNGQEQSGSRWQRFFESSGGAALISGLLSVLLGGLIGTMVQTGTKTKEFQLTAYKEYLEQERNIVLNSTDLVGRCVSASDDLIAITGPDFDPARYPGVDIQGLAIRKTYNECAAQWRKEYRKLSFAMRYYHSGQPAVVGAWDEVQKATTGYMECAQQWYVKHNAAPVETGGVCVAEKNTLTRRFDELNARIGESGRYAWQTWTMPDKPEVSWNKVNVPEEQSQ